MVRILTLSGFVLWRSSARIRWSLGNHDGFPEFCAKSRKWFRRHVNCFFAAVPTKQSPPDVSDFKQLALPLNGRPESGQKAESPPPAAGDGHTKQVLYVCLVESCFRSADPMNPAPATADSIAIPQLSGPLRVALLTPQRMAVMDRGDIVAGSQPAQLSQVNPKTVAVGVSSKSAVASVPREGSIRGTAVRRSSTAMSQQRCDSGAASTPQQFVQLVGCRDRKPGQQQS